MVTINLGPLYRKYLKTKESWKNADLRPSHLYERFKTVLRNTSAEVYICMALGFATATFLSYNKEAARERTIPLGYSEIKQIEEAGPVTRYLANANDVPMKIFECWNRSHEKVSENKVKAFATEIEDIMGSQYSSTSFSELLKSMPKQSEAALDELKKFVSVKDKIGHTNALFDAAWKDRHDDDYRTETYLDTETYTDSDNRLQTRTVIKTREVYDHTHHYYNYYKKEGEEASRSLDSIIAEHNPLGLKEELRKVSQVSEEGKEAIRKSRKNNKKELTEEEILEIANMWNIGSTLNANLPNIYTRWKQLGTDANNWRVAKNTAKSTSYTTDSSSDSGPKEFQIAETALYHGKDLQALITELVAGMEYVKQNAPLLQEKIDELMYIELGYRKGSQKELRKEIMSIAREWYTTNFKNGFDVYPFRLYMVFLSSLLGLVAGGLAGYGLDRLGEKYDLWGRKEY